MPFYIYCTQSHVLLNIHISILRGNASRQIVCFYGFNSSVIHLFCEIYKQNSPLRLMSILKRGKKSLNF